MIARGEIASVEVGRDLFVTAEAVEEAKRRKAEPARPGRASGPDGHVRVTKNGRGKKGGKE